MKISSKLTYVLPFLVLLVPSWLIGVIILVPLIFKIVPAFNYGLYNVLSIVIPIGITVLFYFSFLKLSTKVKPVIWKVILVVLPAILLLSLGRGEVPLYFIFVPGLILLWAFTLFNRRYTATLTEQSILYKNLLGHQGEIPLIHVISLEQKKNILGFLSRYGKLLDISRKTSIGFRNEELDEFEITLFVRAFHHDEVFNKIIDRTNKAGNLKVRQYSY
jgi:hypothetical protein